MSHSKGRNWRSRAMSRRTEPPRHRIVKEVSAGDNGIHGVIDLWLLSGPDWRVSMRKSAQKDHNWFLGHPTQARWVHPRHGTFCVLRKKIAQFSAPIWVLKMWYTHKSNSWSSLLKIDNDHFGFSNDQLFRHTPRWPISSIALPFDNHGNRKFSPMIFPWANHSKPSFFRGFPCLTLEVIPSCLRLRRPVVGAVLADAWWLPASRALRALRPLRAPRRMASRVSAAEKRGRLTRAGNM